jgi:hypothetical protein
MELEESLAKVLLWFDGQGMAWVCLPALNSEMSLREVGIHFALLIQRLPGIIELRYHDGAPFADSATCAWINANVMLHLQAANAPHKVEVNDTRSAGELTLEEVLPILRKDGLKAALQILKQGPQSAQGWCVRFFWLFALVQLCFMAKKYEMAKTQIESTRQVVGNKYYFQGFSTRHGTVRSSKSTSASKKLLPMCLICFLPMWVNHISRVILVRFFCTSKTRWILIQRYSFVYFFIVSFLSGAA